MPRLIGVGDNTVDTYTHLRMRFPGGNALNVAVLAQRYGAQAAYLGWLGKDERGELILNALRQEGLDVSHCRVVEDAPTAYSEVMLVDGDRVFGKSDHGVCNLFHLTDEDLAYIANFDLAHTSVYSHVEPQITELKRASRLLSFDFSQNLDEAYWRQTLPYVDIAFISLAEVPLEELENRLRQMYAFGPQLIVATRGAQGAWLFDGRQIYHQGVLPVQVVDTLGAGDAFAARLLVEYLKGTPLSAAMRRAAESAAQNCTQYGAFGYGQAY
jgi:fructoselysine 6-kinase